MKILHTADWHIGQFKGPVVDGVNLRLQDTVKCLEYMVEVAQKEKPDIVCISGDIFHQEQIGPVRYSDEMIIATDTITKLADIAKGVIVMRGTPNHDGSGQFRVLDRMFVKTSHVHIITAPTVLHTPYTDIACIPGFDKQEFRAKFPGLSADEENLAWTKYISDMVFALRAECEKTPILMAHYTVPGCNMESGQTSFFTNFEPVIPREALMAARYEAVLLGHIHRPQIIEGFDNVFYSGAINAMNFNDEGQERGFWIHEFNEKGTLVKEHRYTTPYRQFHTITWDPDEVGDYIREGAMYLHRTGISEEVTDKIVRVRYSCTSEQKKALNIPLLQKNLYELGAFYVADIEAESTIDITNRGLLSEESDPRLNLKKWLEEKTFKNPDKIVELAEPIIAEAMKQSTTAEIHGVFKPVSISVRNYRNYKEESFDFSDISFCTINGVNGAGKSSLFMDAIVDCLFEETREGDCKAWIRGTEDARSGSIEFIFDIGEKRFRVVRTRTKSGKPTLNLSQYQEESADWMNLSKERIIDTQAEIEKLLGMDSMTFRSCALEILSENRPSEQIYYAKAINRYREFPQLEWFIKMGLYKLAAHLINEYHDGAFGYESRNGIRGLRKSGKTIFEILGLTKENTRILQSIDGNIDELRLLQEAQSSGYNLKAEELERFYKLFGCNTTLIRKENRKSTIHKICRYIEREGADYRVGESGQCW